MRTLLPCLGFVFLLLMSATSRHAYAVDQALFGAGVAIYGGQTGKSLGGDANSMGYYLHFQSEWRKGRLRPSVGATIEFGAGTTSLGGSSAFQLIGGLVNLGIDFYIFKTQYVNPFFGVYGLGGWANIRIDKNSQGFAYGAGTVAGAEITTRKSDEAKKLRITSGYRIIRGKMGEIGVIQLNAIMIELGIVF